MVIVCGQWHWYLIDRYSRKTVDILEAGYIGQVCGLNAGRLYAATENVLLSLSNASKLLAAFGLPRMNPIYMRTFPMLTNPLSFWVQNNPVNKVNTMTLCALAACFARLLAAIELTMHDWYVIVFHAELFQKLDFFSEKWQTKNK